ARSPGTALGCRCDPAAASALDPRPDPQLPGVLLRPPRRAGSDHRGTAAPGQAAAQPARRVGVAGQAEGQGNRLVTLRLYMDHHVPFAITVGLRQRGVDVLTAEDDGTATLDDDPLLERATSLGRA